jgi:hypothetical protein
VPECRGTYLNGQIKEVQVPGRTRNDILVHDRHADRGEAVGQNSSTRIVLELGENATYASIDASPVMGRRLQQEALPLTELLLIHPAYLEILVLLVRHCGFVLGSKGLKRKARGWLSHRMTGIRKKTCSLREAARYKKGIRLREKQRRQSRRQVYDLKSKTTGSEEKETGDRTSSANLTIYSL